MVAKTPGRQTEQVCSLRAISPLYFNVQNTYQNISNGVIKGRETGLFRRSKIYQRISISRDILEEWLSISNSSSPTAAPFTAASTTPEAEWFAVPAEGTERLLGAVSHPAGSA